MGLTKSLAHKSKKHANDITVALGGNPNVGKSTIFNALTGLDQHTGNWPGKTVAAASGRFEFKGQGYHITDLPGTYSLICDSAEEEIASDFLCFSRPDVTVLVLDATCLERNLNLVFQIMEITPNIVICLNLTDQAKKSGIHINAKLLSDILKVPVISACAAKKEGITELKRAIHALAATPKTAAYRIKYAPIIEESIEKITASLSDKVENKRLTAIKLLDSDKKMINNMSKDLGFDILGDDTCRTLSIQTEKLAQNGITADNFCDYIVADLVAESEKTANAVVQKISTEYKKADRKIDKILTSKSFGIPIMLAFLGIILWITTVGANYPSAYLASAFNFLGKHLDKILQLIHTPKWLHGLLLDGIYRTVSWVVSVMLPPMAIFFPMFTLAEDLGYLPRVAFNLDNFFKKCGAHGKQCLTMCMASLIL